jgi:hypothetical protein
MFSVDSYVAHLTSTSVLIMQSRVWLDGKTKYEIDAFFCCIPLHVSVKLEYDQLFLHKTYQNN